MSLDYSSTEDDFVIIEHLEDKTKELQTIPKKEDFDRSSREIQESPYSCNCSVECGIMSAPKLEYPWVCNCSSECGMMNDKPKEPLQIITENNLPITLYLVYIHYINQVNIDNAISDMKRHFLELYYVLLDLYLSDEYVS